MEDTAFAWDGGDLTDLLRLEPLGDDRFRTTRSDRNVGGEIFGGQYLGQVVMAAMATVSDRVPHAMACWFLKAASADRPLEYEVERTREGRRFAHRKVLVRQQGKVVLSADVSMRTPDALAAGHAATPPRVPDPDALEDLAQLARVRASILDWKARSQMAAKPGVLIRPVDPDAGFGALADEPKAACWLKARRCSGSDAGLAYAAVAYLSDFWGNFASRLPHTPNALHGEWSMTTLNHSIWFHQAPAAVDWFLFDVDSPASGHGTGFNRGLVFDRGGRLVASQTQEALMVRRDLA